MSDPHGSLLTFSDFQSISGNVTLIEIKRYYHLHVHFSPSYLNRITVDIPSKVTVSKNISFGHDSWEMCKLLQTIETIGMWICQLHERDRGENQVMILHVHVHVHDTIVHVHVHDTIVFAWNLIFMILSILIHQDHCFICGALNWRFWEFNYFENLTSWHLSTNTISYIKSHDVD